MAREIGPLGALLLALLIAGPAHAARDPSIGATPLELSADELEVERERDIYVARGNVRLVQGAKTLSADWMSFSPSGGRGIASGNVVYADGADRVYSSFVEFNLDTLQGVLLMAHFDAAENRFRMEGAEILKTGERSYEFERGRFTTCRCPHGGEDPWQIRAESAELEVEGYAVARNTTVNILGVPIIWLPWMLYPVKTERDTGLLLPEFGYRKRTGFEVGVPFFWAAAPNVNVLLTPRWLSKRGVKGEVETEYLIGEQSSGEVFASFIHDDDVDANSVETPYDRERWIAKGEQELHLPHDWRLRSAFQVVSDNAYPTDFSDLDDERHDRFLESNAFATKRFNSLGDYGFVAAVQYADDLQNPDDLDRDEYLLHRLPQAEYTMLPTRAPWLEQLVPSFDVQYAYFGQYENPNQSFASINYLSDATGVAFPSATLSADGLFYDVGIDALANAQEQQPEPFPAPPVVDPNRDDFLPTGGSEGNGRFDEGEPLADRGHRLKLNPRFAIPGRLGNFIELYPEVGWRQTFYDSRSIGHESWGALTGRVDLRTRLRRGLGLGIAHILEPRVGYALVVAPDLDDEPLFTPSTALPQLRIRALDLDNVTRDFADRVDDFNGLTWGIGNRFYREASRDQGARLLADVALLTQYDFNDGGDLGNLVLDASGQLGAFSELRLNIGFDPEDSALDEALAESVWRGKRLALRLRYRYLKTIPNFFEDFLQANDRYDDFQDGFDRVDQIDATAAFRLTDNWLTRYELIYEFDRTFMVTNRFAIEYLSRCDCWAIGVEARQNRNIGFELGVVYRIVGLGRGGAPAVAPGRAQFSLLDGS